MDVETDIFEKITFCQAQPVETYRGWDMIKNPLRTISRAAYAPGQYAKCLNRYKSGIGLCLLASHQGIPVLQEHAIRLIDTNSRPLGSVDKSSALDSGTDEIKIRYIPMTTRRSFERAFDISVRTQYLIEGSLAGDQDNLATYLNRYKHYHKQSATHINID